MHKFEVVGTKGGGAVCTQYLEKSLDEADAFVVSQPEYYPLSRLNEAIESIKFRAVSKNPSKAWPNHSGPHPYSMFEVREILIDLEKN